MYIYMYIYIYVCIYIYNMCIYIYVYIYMYIFKTRAVGVYKRSSTSTKNIWKIVDFIPLENIMLHKFSMSKECSMFFKEVQYCFF